MEALTAWVLTVVLALAATERVEPSPDFAPAIAQASLERPLPGDRGAERMAAVMIALSWNEARFDVNALGDCKDKNHRTWETCQSVGAWQVSKWWKPVRGDVYAQARGAARLVEESFRACAKRPLQERLSWFAAGGGGCSDRGAPASRWRMSEAGRLLREHPRDPEVTAQN